VGFGSKERPRNGIFGVWPARKMGREPKKRKMVVGVVLPLPLLPL